MPITSLHAENIKCFDELSVTFDPLMVVIGANASGKSGFISILSFLRDIVKLGLMDALAVRGGGKYLMNLRTGKTQVRIRINYSDPELLEVPFLYPDDSWGVISVTNTTTEFILDFSNDDVKILKDEVSLDAIIEHPGYQVEKGVWKVARKSNNMMSRSFTREDGTIIDSSVIPIIIPDIPLPANHLIIEYPTFYPAWSLNNYLRNITVTDITPKSAKLGRLIGEDSGLAEDGSNMSLVLDRLLKNPENKRKFMNITRDFLPYIHDVSVPHTAGLSSYIAITETCDPTTQIPAPLISDGTLSILGLILMITSSDKNCLILEEPERAVHPSLMKKLASLLMDASLKKQIVITTHNPELIKYLPPKSLLLLSRGECGCSFASCPHERRDVSEFVKNEIGIEELYIQGKL